MNSRNFSYIRNLLLGSCITDEILNRIFCLNKPEVKVNQWCKLDDESYKEIADWIKTTDRRVKAERLRAKLRARYWAQKQAKINASL